MQYDVRGYVKNLPNGTVELVMEGPAEDMSHLVDDVNRKMSGFIRDVQLAAAPATGEFQQFAIRH
jgi:acylphosphatase